jgi:hypothetical protein
MFHAQCLKTKSTRHPPTDGKWCLWANDAGAGHGLQDSFIALDTDLWDHYHHNKSLASSTGSETGVAPLLEPQHSQ